MKNRLRVSTAVCALIVGVAMVLPSAQAEDISKGQAAEFILATAKAAPPKASTSIDCCRSSGSSAPLSLVYPATQ